MKPKYEIKFTPRFSRRIRSLSRETQVKILREVSILSESPLAGKPLHGEFRGTYSLRVGDYRVLYQIKNQEIYLLTVGHRSRIYGR